MPLKKHFKLVSLTSCLASAQYLDAATLLHHWKLNESSGSAVADTAGVAEMSLVGANTGWGNGQIDGAFVFNGSNYTQTQSKDTVANPSGSVAIAGWFKTDANTAELSYLFQIERAYGMRIRSGGFQLSFSGDVSGSPVLGSGIDDGLWHHFVAQSNGSTTELYLDGSKVGSRNEALASLTGESKHSALGAKQSGARPYAGSLDDVRYYAGTLTEPEIRTLALVSDVPPVATDDSYTVGINQQLSVVAPGVLSNDSETDGHAVTASLVSDVAQGSLSLSSDGSFLYDPPMDFSGIVSFSYEAVDVDGSSNIAQVELTVLDPNTSLTAEEIAQIETDLGITLSAQEILDLSSIVKPQGIDSWRNDANVRIETYRKSNLSVEVVDSQGTPIPGAEVRMELKKHAFKFGGVVTVMDLTDADNDLSNAGSTTDDWKRITTALFNAVGLNNGFKPRITGQHEYIPNFMTWAAANDLDVRAHLLLWPGTGDIETMDTVGAVSGVDYGRHLTTASTSDYASYDVLGAVETYKASARTQADKDALEAVVDAEVLEWVSQWDVYEWDVINETLSNKLLQEILGYDQMAEWFNIAEAHKVDGDAKLFINEFQLVSAKFESGSTSYETRRDTYFSRIDRVIDDGGAVDGIGFQSRFKFLTDYDPATVYARLDEFATRYPDMDLVGTEFEIKDNYHYETGELIQAYDEMTRAQMTEEVLHVYFSHDQVTGMNAWDYMNPLPDGTDAAYTRAMCYYGDGVGGVDGPIVKLNALVWYYLHRIRYHSDVELSTDTEGEVMLRGFNGEHELTVTYDGQDYASSVSLLADGARQIVLEDVTLPPTEAVIEHWEFNDSAETQLQDTSKAAGTALFIGATASAQTDGIGALEVTQHPTETVEWQGDFIFAQPLVFGKRDTGTYEMEFRIRSADLTVGDPNGATVGFGLVDSVAGAELFLIRLNKTVGGLAISSYIDGTYTQLHTFNGQFALTEPVTIRSVVNLDTNTADVYLTVGDAPEVFKQQVPLSSSATVWDGVLYVAQNNQTDWGATDAVSVDYLKLSKLDLDSYEAWVNRVNWSGELLQSELENPDGDSMVNLLEYALGGDPVVKDDGLLLPRIVQWGGAAHYELTLGVDSVDVSYILEYSIDLEDWNALAPTQIHGQLGETVRIPLMDESYDMRFSRLKVRQN